MSDRIDVFETHVNVSAQAGEGCRAVKGKDKRPALDIMQCHSHQATRS